MNMPIGSLNQKAKKTEEFCFSPSSYVPFRDPDVIERIVSIRRDEIDNHPNPDFKIRVMADNEIAFLWIIDMFHRIKTADDEDRPIVLIIPQPYPRYRRLAYLINKFEVNCRNLHTFNMDEYANEDGKIAPETWKYGFGYAAKNHFYAEINPDLRPPEDQIVVFNDDNVNCYGRMLEDLGGADVSYSGPGWTGHLAFIEPDTPELNTDLEAWKATGPRLVTLNPFTIAQNSLHGSFGMSGNLAAVPPKAATIGPAQVIAAKHRIDLHSISIGGSQVSWQRFITRLCLHGPVTPKIPSSILQELRTDCYVSHESAMNIEPNWEKGY